MRDEEHAHEDPLIDEVRRRRREVLEDCGGSLDKLFDLLEAKQKEHPERLKDPRGHRVSPITGT